MQILCPVCHAYKTALETQKKILVKNFYEGKGRPDNATCDELKCLLTWSRRAISKLAKVFGNAPIMKIDNAEKYLNIHYFLTLKLKHQ